MNVRPARGVDQVLAVANARHGPAGHWHTRAGADDPDHDHLGRPDDAREFLTDHGVAAPSTAPPPRVLEALRRLAGDVRAVADGAETWPTPPLAGRLRTATYRLEPDGRLTSAASEPWDRVVDELLAAAVALGERREQLRACENARCRFIFLDRSRNRSRRWCDMAACGNRAKLQRYRGRGRRQRPGRMSGLSTSQAITTSTSTARSTSIGRRSGR